MTTALPKVSIVATGGSIAGIGPNRLDYILYPELVTTSPLPSPWTAFQK
jgi:hypothetical protein